MHQRDNRPYGKTPLEAHGHVHENGNQGYQYRQRTVFRQFIAHLGADEFHTTQLHLAAGLFAQQAKHLVAQFRALDAFARGQTNQHIPGCTELLYLGFGKTIFGQYLPGLFQIRILAVTNLDQGSPGEVDTKDQSPHGQ